MIDLDRLRAFEEALDPRHPTGVIAYGEISAVVVLPDRPDVVLKRMSGFRDEGEVAGYIAVVEAYIDALRARGVDVVATAPVAVHTEQHGHVVHLVQRRLPTEHLGPAWIGDDQALWALMRAVYDEVARVYAANDDAVTLAIDAQLSNWAWDGEHLVYLDIGTPFLRHGGAEQLDWSLVVRPLPPGLRWLVLRFVVPDVAAKYYRLDAVLTDVVGNLVKEGGADRVPAAVALTNTWAAEHGLDLALTVRAVESYYAWDARLWELLSRVRRATRAAYTLFGQRYGFLIPGPVRRHRDPQTRPPW